MTARQRRVERRSQRKRGPILLGAGVTAAIGAIAALSVGLWVLDVAAEAPPLEELKPIEQGENSVVYASDGTRLGVINSDTVRRVAPLEKIAPVVRQATIAIEDAEFYSHAGVDFDAVVRAAVENVEAGEVVQGGSTITQQLIKILYTGRLEDRDFEAKIKEAELAEELEERLSKDEILEQYLNNASYGNTASGREAVGITAAARTYFDKRPGELSLKEAALLAGLPQAPTAHNPLINPKGAKRRRNDVLDAMAREGHIPEAKANRLSDKALGVTPTDRFTSTREQYFFDYVVERLIDSYGVARVREGGLKIHTTIDLAKQESARRALDNRLAGVGPAGAVVTTDVDTGNILAMVSNAEYESSKFNLAAQGQRQPGSAFKTFVLTAAVRQGADPESTYYESQSPIQLETPLLSEPWEVTTFDNSSQGTISLRQATLSSDNTVFAQLDLDVGPEYVTETAYDMGITSELNSFPAEGIGGLELGVTPLEMSNAYRTLASGGVRHPANAIKRVELPNGKVDRPGRGEGGEERAFSDGVAAEVTGILSDNVDSGTGTAAQIGCPQAGKTGTTDNFRDAWFVGYTPRLSTAVWVGYPDRQIEMRTEHHGGSVSGGTFPAEIWGDYMEEARAGFCGGFPAPDDPFEPQPFSGEYSQSSSGEGEDSAGEESGEEESGGEENGEDSGNGISSQGGVSDGSSAGGVVDPDNPGAYAPGIQE